jgi:gluconate kinase
MATHRSYAVLLSGTHVTGKETLALHLSQALGCPWLKADMAQNAAFFGARAHSRRNGGDGSGDDIDTGVFGRIWLAKMQRLGLELNDSNIFKDNECNIPVQPVDVVGKDADAAEGNCLAILSCYAMRRPTRDAIRAALQTHGATPIFVVLQISPETLSGRTLGAEEPELAARIMAEKAKDIREVGTDEEGEAGDVMVVDSLRDVDALFEEIRVGILDRVGRGKG